MGYWQVTLNGVALRKWMTRAEADAFAERWQGSAGGYRGSSGLLKHKDRGDHVEVKPDVQANREFDERYKVAKAKEPQTVHYTQYVENNDEGDQAMRRQ